MRTRARTAPRVVDDQPASAESRATVTFVLLALAIAIYFMWPHQFTLEVAPLPPLNLGSHGGLYPSVVEPWHVGDYGQFQHKRYVDGSTCTVAISGRVEIQVCR